MSKGLRPATAKRVKSLTLTRIFALALVLLAIQRIIALIA